eukprot:COSAG01_NODE_1868_length_9028_cov_3.001232_13_plen_196_part_00
MAQEQAAASSHELQLTHGAQAEELRALQAELREQQAGAAQTVQAMRDQLAAAAAEAAAAAAAAQRQRQEGEEVQGQELVDARAALGVARSAASAQGAELCTLRSELRAARAQTAESEQAAAQAAARAQEVAVCEAAALARELAAAQQEAATAAQSALMAARAVRTGSSRPGLRAHPSPTARAVSACLCALGQPPR